MQLHPANVPCWSAYAETSECMRLLLDIKSFIHAKDNVGNTALIMAVELQDNTIFTKLLLSHGEDVESQDRDAWRPLHWSASRNRSAYISVWLQQGVDIHASTLKSTTALEYAITFNSHYILSILLDDDELEYARTGASDCCVTHQAALYGDIETLGILRSTKLSKIDLCSEKSGW